MQKNSDLAMTATSAPDDAAPFLRDLASLLALTKDGCELSEVGVENQIVQCTVLIEALREMGHDVHMEYAEARALIPSGAISFEGWVMGLLVTPGQSFLVDPFGSLGQEAIEERLRSALLADLATNHPNLTSSEYEIEPISWAPPSLHHLGLMLSFHADKSLNPNHAPSFEGLKGLAVSLVQGRDLQGSTPTSSPQSRPRF